MTVYEAIAAAEVVLPGEAAAAGEIDVRWQVIIQVGDFVEHEPEVVWPFVLRWGRSADADLRMAVATCLLEHLLEHHHDRLIELVENAAATSALFADTVSSCWIDAANVDEARRERLKKLARYNTGRSSS